jgi:hypothetical protein
LSRRWALKVKAALTRCIPNRFGLNDVENAEWARDAEGEKEARDNEKPEHVAEWRQSRVSQKQSGDKRRHN